MGKPTKRQFSISSIVLFMTFAALLCGTFASRIADFIESSFHPKLTVPVLDHVPYFVAGRTYEYKDGRYVAKPRPGRTITISMPMPKIEIREEEEVDSNGIPIPTSSTNKVESKHKIDHWTRCRV